MPSKKPLITHRGVVITPEGRKRVKLRRTATTWCQKGGKKSYHIEDGYRCGAPGRARLLLDTIVEIPEDELEAANA